LLPIAGISFLFFSQRLAGFLAVLVFVSFQVLSWSADRFLYGNFWCCVAFFLRLLVCGREERRAITSSTILLFLFFVFTP
jgi:hypothetical protein